MARSKQVAWDAAHSAKMREQFKLKRTSSAPMKLETDGIQYYLNRNRWDKIEVAIPDSGHTDIFHGYYIGVTISRDTFQVLNIYESFWP